MTFAIVYVENGDFVEDFDNLEEARSAMAEFVADHPEVAHRVGIVPFGDDGVPVGDFEPLEVFGGSTV